MKPEQSGAWEWSQSWGNSLTTSDHDQYIQQYQQNGGTMYRQLVVFLLFFYFIFFFTVSDLMTGLALSLAIMYLEYNIFTVEQIWLFHFYHVLKNDSSSINYIKFILFNEIIIKQIK